MATPAFAIKIKERNAPFLTQPAAAPLINNVQGYITSIEGWLWGKNEPGLAGRLNAIKNDNQFKTYMKGAGAAPANMRTFLLRLDHIAYDIKSAAGNEYECTPVTANVNKKLDNSSATVRDLLGQVIDVCTLQSENENATPTHTIASLPPPNSTYRIDRESITPLPASPRYWTYRIQAGSPTYGGILLQAGVRFNLISVRNALRASLATSSPSVAQGIYVQLSAPAWLNAILSA